MFISIILSRFPITCYDLLLRETNSNPRKHVDYQLAIKGLKPNPRMESISNLAIMNMVINNMGVAVMPLGICEPYLERKLIRKVDTDIEIVRPIHIIYNKKKKLSTTVKTAIHIYLLISYKIIEMMINDIISFFDIDFILHCHYNIIT